MRLPLAARCALLACLFSCASTAPVVPSAPTEVPRTAMDAMCNRLRNEGIAGEIAVVSTTEPLVNHDSMIALANSAFYHGKEDPARYAETIAAELPKLPFVIGPGACELRAVANQTEARVDQMLLQISAPFVNPFTRGSAGLFARLSLGNEAAQWYWIPVALRNGAWYAGPPQPLGVRN